MPSPHSTNRPDAPTSKQLRYLRELANSTGQTFTYPTTKQQASAEIRRLTKQTADNPVERGVERDRLQHEVELPVDAAAYREDEVTGHGSSAHWTHHPDERPETTAGAERKLATYELPDGTTRALGPPPVSWSQVVVVVVAVHNRRLCTAFSRAPAPVLVRSRPSGSPAA